MKTMNNTPEIETIAQWQSPATAYPRKRICSARIANAYYEAGVYPAHRTQGKDYFIASKRLRITVLKIDGKTWMVDDPPHWWAMIDHAAAFEGHVLCAGLGLGLMVHALTNNPKVERITVVERSQDVIDLISPFVPPEKLTIIHADWFEQNKATIPNVNGVLFDLFVGNGHDFIGPGISIATEIMHRWDFPLVRVHGLMNPWIGDVATAIATAEQSDDYKQMIERMKAQGLVILGARELDEMTDSMKNP
jgi:hypothetical protein